MRILHLVNSTGYTCPVYWEHVVPTLNETQSVLCTYFPTCVELAPAIRIVDGNGTILGYIRNLLRVLSSEEFDVIHVHYTQVGFIFLLVNTFYRLGLMRTTVFTMHTSYSNLKTRNKLLAAIGFLAFHRIVFCGEASSQSFPNWFGALAGKKTRVVPNGINSEAIDAVLADSKKPSRVEFFTVVVVGRLVAVKNIATILSAFRVGAIPTSKLLIIGDGELRTQLEKQAQELGILDQIEFKGMVSRKEVYQYLNNADLFVSASWVEGLPIAVMEAMYCGCPVLLSDIPVHREIVSRLEFVPLISPKNIDGFAESIKHFSQLTPAERLSIGHKCRSSIKKSYTLQQMLSGYYEIYREIIA